MSDIFNFVYVYFYENPKLGFWFTFLAGGCSISGTLLFLIKNFKTVRKYLNIKQPIQIYSEYKELLCNTQRLTLNFLFFSTKAHDKISNLLDNTKLKIEELKIANKKIKNKIKKEKENENKILEFKNKIKDNEDKILEFKGDFFKNFQKYQSDILSQSRDIFSQIVQDSFKLLFNHVKNGPCRVCLKNFDPTSGKLQKIAICPQNTNIPSPLSYDSNDTAINEVAETEDYYVCNDIPKKLYEEGYDGPRLISRDDILKLCKGRVFKLRWLKKNWVEAWNDKKTNNRNEYRYMSSAIIPLSLRHNTDNIELQNNDNAIKKLWDCIGKGKEIKFRRVNDEKIYDRGPFGYLCLDSVKTNYFDIPDKKAFEAFKKSSHLNVGYFVADLLSIVMFIYYSYGEFSEIYKECVSFFNTIKDEVEKNIDINLQ